MVSVTDVVSVTSTSESVGEESIEIGTHFDFDNADTSIALVPKSDAQNVRESGAEKDFPLVIRISSKNETRDDVDGGAIEEEDKTDVRENNLSNEASDKKKKRSKAKTRKFSKRNSKAKGAVDNTLISPRVDDMIDNMIYTCDPLFEANYKGAFDALIQLDVADEEPSERGDEDTEDDEDVQSKIDRILSLGVSSEKEDDASDYGKFDLNGLAAIVKQKREIDDLVLSKGLVDAELQDTKEKLRNASNAMEELKQSNGELQEKVLRLQSRLDNKETKAEHAVRKEQEMSKNYMNDLDEALSAIEYQKEQRHNDSARHRKAMADLTFALEEETRKNDERSDEILLLKQQLIDERSKRYCVEELIQEKNIKNEELCSDLHKKERYCFELEHTMKMTTKGMKKEYKDLLKVNEDLVYKLSSSKEKLKRSRRERNELQFRLERLSNSLRVDASTEIMKLEEEREVNVGMEGGIDDDIFLSRQNQRMERLKRIMS